MSYHDFHLASRICCCFITGQSQASSQDCSGTYPILLAVSIRSSTTTLSARMLFALIHTLMPLSHSLEEVLTHVSVSVVPIHAPDALVRCFLTRIIVFRNTLAVKELTSAPVRDLVHHSVALDSHFLNSSLFLSQTVSVPDCSARSRSVDGILTSLDSVRRGNAHAQAAWSITAEIEVS